MTDDRVQEKTEGYEYVVYVDGVRERGFHFISDDYAATNSTRYANQRRKELAGETIKPGKEWWNY